MKRSWLVGALALLLLPSPGRALVRFDFEGPYLVDPGHTLKDHALVHDGQLFHIFYIRGEQGVPGTASEDSLGHATSPDLRRWTLHPPALAVGPGGSWDSRSVWAPELLPPAATGGPWRMLYTGVDDSIVQRMGVAEATAPGGGPWGFTKQPGNPALQPAGPSWDWTPGVAFSSFRDPFVYHDGSEWVLLHTAGVVDSTLGSGRRGAIHRATSTDLASWTEQAPLALHNGPDNKAWHDIESVQLLEVGGRWHLFYSETDEVGIRHQSSTQPDAGWDFANPLVIDAGIAPEVNPGPQGGWLISRHVPYDPGDGVLRWTIRVDSLRFDGPLVDVVRWDTLAEDWPVRTGAAFLVAPTFGDNGVWRGEASAGLDGHGYLSSREFWDGPLGSGGSPGAELGGNATGLMESRPFVLEGDRIELLVGGGGNPDCSVQLVDGNTGFVLFEELGSGSNTMTPRTWPVDGLQGREVFVRVQDSSSAPDGWIQVDRIRELVAPVAAPSPARPGRVLGAVPNPFNPATTLRFELDAPARAGLRVVDARGRTVRRLPARDWPAGQHGLRWDGRDDGGRPVASGSYRVLLELPGATIPGPAALLLR